MREITVQKNDAGQRLDKFLTKAVKGLPLSLMYKFIRIKKIKVNRARTDQKYMLQQGDVIQLFIKDEFFDVPAKDKSALHSIVPKLDIVYEDDNIILCNKRPGVLVHEDKGAGENTLIMHIQAYLAAKGEYNPEEEQSFSPALCNRIDRNTGGIVIAAKNAEALREMNQKIKDDEISKFYFCIAHGTFEKRQDTLHGWLRKDAATNTVRVFDKKTENAKEIITKYRVLKTSHDLSLLEVELVTGRTHQIRAHLSHIGHPLLGDGKYGVNRDDKKDGYKYQALYAYKLVFSFANTDGPLGYLKDKVVKLNPDDIWFYKEFGNKS